MFSLDCHFFPLKFDFKLFAFYLQRLICWLLNNFLDDIVILLDIWKWRFIISTIIEFYLFQVLNKIKNNLDFDSLGFNLSWILNFVNFETMFHFYQTLSCQSILGISFNTEITLKFNVLTLILTFLEHKPAKESTWSQSNGKWSFHNLEKCFEIGTILQDIFLTNHFFIVALFPLIIAIEPFLFHSRALLILQPPTYQNGYWSHKESDRVLPPC